jgi:ParB/RepB/Spo0J family partition protein
MVTEVTEMEDTTAIVRRERIPIEDLTMDPLQSRSDGWSGSEVDRKLAASIKSQGLLQDILVRPLSQLETDVSNADATYAIVAGSRRYHAALEAGIEEVPCKILDANDIEAAWTSLVENIDREDLSEQEVANQLGVIYELIKPREEPEACPQCGTNVDGEAGLTSHWGQSSCSPPNVDSRDIDFNNPENRFVTDRQARRYLAWHYLGRADDTAVNIISGHLRTAQLPPLLQSLFKEPSERSGQERTALENYGIDPKTTLGSGVGRSKASQVVASVYDTVDEAFDADAVNPTDAVLEAVGELRISEASEKDFEKSLRRFRRELSSEVAQMDETMDHQACFREVLHTHSEDLREASDELDATQPFKRVDVRSPETQQYSRWYARAHAGRDVRSHGELIRELYQERLESLAEEQGWE